VSVTTSPISKQTVPHFSCSNPTILDYVDQNILGIIGILPKEHQMKFWFKKKGQKNCSDTPKNLKNETESGNPNPYSTA